MAPPLPARAGGPEGGNARAGLLFLVAALAFVLVAWAYRNFTLDDPFIIFRYARNLVAGAGLVYNPGQSVEGFSSPAWVALSSLWILVAGPDVERMAAAAKAMAALFGLVALMGCWRLGALLCPESAPLAGLASALILALTLYFPAWSASGSETSLFSAELVWLLVLFLEDAARGRVPLRPALLGAALAWTRPEGLGFAALVASAIAGHALRRPRRLADLALAAVPFGALLALFATRWAIYGELLPNTYYAKSSHGMAQVLLDGADYLRHWVAAPGFALLAAALVGAFTGARARPTRTSSIVALSIALLIIAVVWWEGGDWMPGFRFLMPAYPLLAALAGAGIARGVGQARFAGVAAPACALMVASPWVGLVYLAQQASFAGPGQPPALIPEDRLAVGRWLEAHAPPDSLIATGEAGVVPYVSNHRYVDVFGLTDKTIARMPGKWVYKTPTSYVLSQDPDYIVLYGDHFRELAGPDVERFEFAYANAFLADERFSLGFREAYARGRFAVFCRTNEAGDCRKFLLPGAAGGKA